MNALEPRLEQALVTALGSLRARGELLPEDRLNSHFSIFRSRFGPDRLRALDGAELLQVMHTHGNKDSLVYWLEFKDDDEFPSASKFGGIGGGSAFKFGLFKRKENGQWVAGSPQNPRDVTVKEAAEIAAAHRDQLIAGFELISALPADAADSDYVKLQASLRDRMPALVELAWAHKYFSLLFPTKLDDFHSSFWQRYHLIKLLQVPPDVEGLYVCAGRFVELSRRLGSPMNHATAALLELNGAPKKYWRIGTTLGENPSSSIWQAMRDGNYVAVGWSQLGDLTPLVTEKDAREHLRERLLPFYKDDPRTPARKAGELRDFIQRMDVGDVVVAATGRRVLGIGVVKDGYRYAPTQLPDAPHHRPVEWRSLQEWNMGDDEGLRTTVFPLGKNPPTLVEIEKRILNGGVPGPSDGGVRVADEKMVPVLHYEGIIARFHSILERKGQVIAYGPPGTGKTYWARRAAHELAAGHAFGKRFADVTQAERDQIVGNTSQLGFVRSCTFHPAYGYEDFIEGYRPRQSEAGQLVFEERQGIFKSLCADAAATPGRRFYLLIDEINRGDIPRIFGELLTLLEKDKRGMEVALPVSGARFSVPSNVYIIGTMNTADKSIALLDTALRRRFGFIELLPDLSMIPTATTGVEFPLRGWVAGLNERILVHCGRDARNLQVGHAYFMEDGKPVSSFPLFVRVLAEDIVPLLEEYCYEDYRILKNILGEGVIDERRQRVKEDLFRPENHQVLAQVLNSPDVATSAPATEQQEPAVDEDNDDTSGAAK